MGFNSRDGSRAIKGTAVKTGVGLEDGSVGCLVGSEESRGLLRLEEQVREYDIAVAIVRELTIHRKLGPRK